MFSKTPLFSGSLGWEKKLWISKIFLGGYLFVFVECLCHRSSKMGTKYFKNYVSLFAIVNYQNWQDPSAPLTV